MKRNTKNLFESKKGKAFQDLGRGSDFMFTWPGNESINESPKISHPLVPPSMHARTHTICTSVHVAMRRVNWDCAGGPLSATTQTTPGKAQESPTSLLLLSLVCACPAATGQLSPARSCLLPWGCCSPYTHHGARQ